MWDSDLQLHHKHLHSSSTVYIALLLSRVATCHVAPQARTLGIPDFAACEERSGKPRGLLDRPARIQQPCDVSRRKWHRPNGTCITRTFSRPDCDNGRSQGP